MKINDRLKKIGDLVEANSFCLDVGCDHGLLDIYLVKKRVGIKAIASDIAEGPLKQASNNIKREHLENEIEVKLGDGLEAYTEQVDTVIISGMGGRSIVGILKDRPDVLKKVKTIIISPNNYQEDVKRYLCKNGFYIENEEFVKDKKFIYQIIIFKKGKRKYTKKDYFFGPVFLIKKGPLFREYYEREMKSREILISLLPKNFRYKKYQTRKEIEMIKNEIED
jgi:tRNA (adenine22-N1)-methyltransferase